MVEGTWGWSKGEYIERLKGENWRQGEGGAGRREQSETEKLSG